ncbi:MAG: hypothetical protein ACTHJ3_19620 [Pararhizobium sp.]
MAKISGSIPNFANGVSQQAMALRLATQGDLQINAYSTVVEGLRKRPPTNSVASIGNDIPSQVYVHSINRDTSERYSVLFSAAGVRVFDINGVERDVNAPGGFGYLGFNSGIYQRPPYRAITVGDYTFVTNTSVATAMDASVVESPSKSEALINVMAGNYGKDYTISINGTEVARYRTPDGTSAAQSPAVDTAYIARRLATGETVALSKTVNGDSNGNWTWMATDSNLAGKGINAANGWTVRVFKGSIYILREDGTPFSVAVEDGYNGHAMKAIQGSVQDFSDLPAFCEDGMAVKVSGSVSTEFDDYYVRFGKQSPDDPISTPGVWREVPQPGIKTQFDAATMPHTLVREEDGTFTFKALEWEARKAGDAKTIPEPSFVGKVISELTFFKNRLGFLSGENVILSREGSYFDFWRATATALLDDDPIDVACTDAGVSILRSAEAITDRLILFADQKQFSFMGNELLTPKTASVRVATAFQASAVSRPVASGPAIFFAVDRGQFSMVREFRVDDSTGVADADDITGHVPQYLPGRVIKMAASTHEDILVVQSDGAVEALYVYKYYWANNQKLQASWSRWEFPGVSKVLDFWFVESRLYVLAGRANGVFIEYMEVQPGGTDEDNTFVTHLDRRFRVEPSSARTYDPYTDLTYIPMEQVANDDAYVVVTAGSGSSSMQPGLEVEVTEFGTNHVIVRGDLRDVPVHLGVPYEMRYRLSTIFLREQSRGGGTEVITEGRLQLIQLLLQFSKTAYFRVEITPLAQQMRAYFTNGRLMGDPLNITDKVTLGDGTFRVPILSKNDRVRIELVNDSYLPCSILAAEWVGNYVMKSKRT